MRNALKLVFGMLLVLFGILQGAVLAYAGYGCLTFGTPRKFAWVWFVVIAVVEAGVILIWGRLEERMTRTKIDRE